MAEALFMAKDYDKAIAAYQAVAHAVDRNDPCQIITDARYKIDFAQPKTPVTPESPHYWSAEVYATTTSPLIPSGATAIGMWINPHGCMNTLLAKYRDSRITGPQVFAFLYGFQDAEYLFNHTQDNWLLDWEGWRWAVLPFSAPYWHTGPFEEPQGNLTWQNPFYLEKRYSQSATADICGVTYLM